MPTKGHTEGQIVAVLRQVEAGERCRHLPQGGDQQAAYYLWKTHIRQNWNPQPQWHR